MVSQQTSFYFVENYKVKRPKENEKTGDIILAGFMAQDLGFLNNLTREARQEVFRHLILIPEVNLAELATFTASNASTRTPPQDQKTYYLLEKIPPEIRKQIFSYLLIITHCWVIEPRSRKTTQALFFKSGRSDLLEILELQYQPIAKASATLANFIKEQKRPHKLLAVHGRRGKERLHVSKRTLAEGILYLEKYPVAFKNAHFPTVDLRADYKLYQKLFNNYYYSICPAESAIKRLNTLLDDEEYADFYDLFRQAVDNLDTHCLTIRKARTELFK
ncbi:hypothetical protein G7Y89_g2017 [Cudoniella acicularis]|uniref:Uncharacterized protein n=1 Tax=Cudoniella acicularis TaxID=354080 RepID=A0A8H4RX25_9HELO|nr:hypothetical protein G7Y89_g2017 [Cudoniella acicularis]